MTPDPIVEWAQRALNKLGVQPPLKVDGIDGPKTDAVINAFEDRHGLGIDGLLGADTRAALARESGMPEPTPAPAQPAAAIQPSKETSTVTAAQNSTPSAPIAPASTASTYAPIFSTLEGLRTSVDTEALAIYHKVAPWYVQTFVKDKVITDAINAAFAAVEGATAGVVQKLPTIDTIVRTAMDYIDAHEPSFLKFVTEPVEDLVIVKLQKLGVLPADFSRAAAKAA